MSNPYDDELNQDEIDKLLEEGEGLGSEMNEESLIQCLKSIREKIKVNATFRIKYSNLPEKYMESEVDLHEEIKVLQRIAAYPNLIQTFVDGEGVEILTSLLSHENIDIVNDATVVIEEITDSDYLQDLSHPKEFLEHFISNNLFDLLVSNLLRTNDLENKEDEQIVSDILSVIENFLDVYPFSAKLFGEKTKLISWLLNRIRVHEEYLSRSKLFASEILMNLIQSSTDNQIILAKLEGMPHLIKIIFENQNKNPVGDEEEFIQNIVNTICACLLTKENQSIFRNSDGINLVLNLLKENNLFRHIGVKILDFATQNNPKNCREFVECDGLSPLFSYFMGKGLKNKKRYESLIEIAEEHCLTILSNLTKYLKGIQLDRFIFKFREKEGEKLERLFEFYKKFQRKLIDFENKEIEREDDEECEEKSEEEKYFDRVNSGLFNIQSISVIISFLYTSDHQDIKNKIHKLIGINSVDMQEIKNNLIEMNSHLGEESFQSETGEYVSNKHFIENLIKKL
jgi:beta-catenin-like protein 1